MTNSHAPRAVTPGYFTAVSGLLLSLTRKQASDGVPPLMANGTMPLPAILLSLLGLTPFIVCGLGALGPDTATATHMLTALIGYAAVALAFAGGVHWGFALQSRQPETSQERVRFGLGVLPPLFGWIALLLLMVAPWMALLLLIAAYIGAALLEQEAGRRELMPPRYLWLRWAFTIVSVAMLITVLTLRLLGQTLAVF